MSQIFDSHIFDSRVFDSRSCFLGEGPLWHPLREQLFWFDIINKRLLSRKDDKSFEWNFDWLVSAAGWIDQDHLLIASEQALMKFDINTGEATDLIALEADNPTTRSNDGRADPMGGFWIGTMGKQAEAEAGAIYRFYRGELRQTHDKITIPNSICFAPDGSRVFFADTAKQIIWSQALDAEGWPVSEPEKFIDLRAKGLFPDGSVIDANGDLWNAQWGSGSVARYSSQGEFLERVYVSGAHSSCPAFGGPELDTLFVTTAQEGIDQPTSADGVVYAIALATKGVSTKDIAAKGVAEPNVVL